MVTTITLTDSMVGTVISPAADGFITKMTMTQAQWPAWQQENHFAFPLPRGRWTSGRLVLTDLGGVGRRVFNFATQHGVFFGSRVLMNGGSIGFRGDLFLEAIPKGQEWEVDFSDVPVRSQQAA